MVRNWKRIGRDFWRSLDATSHKKMMSVEKNETIYGLSGATEGSKGESVRVFRESVREFNYNI